jgi:hypothetical protein
MSDWIDFDRWRECARMERRGYVFEIKNERGQSLLTVCTAALTWPAHWTSAPVAFRLIKEPKPRHSTPIPKLLPKP